MTLSSATDSVEKVPVVKAKATHVIMNYLITKQTQERLRDVGYTPHRGLTTKETKHLPVAEALHKLELQSGERTKEETEPVSAHNTPHSSPKQKPGALPGPNPSTIDYGSGDKDRNLSGKQTHFGPRSLQKYDSGSFATQAYQGVQKPSPMKLIHAQPPKMDILPPWTHKLKPHTLNVLTPTGF
uniref:Putative monooxygenase p33MONOX n=1 Tax=Saimiri boliviensis boliviensis TaxID=39432 RepID=A0A2K6UNI0_SAIBB